MSETEDLAKTLNKCIKIVVELFNAAALVGMTIVGIIITIIATYALYFAYGWASSHLDKIAILVGICAFWVVTNWRK